MRFVRIIVIAGIILALGFSPKAMATGIGLMGGFGGGAASFMPESPRVDFSSALSTKSIGFLFDSRVAENEIFNYRLFVAYQSLQYDDLNNFVNINEIESLKKPGDNLGSLDGFVIDQTFGFGVLRKKLVRLFVGPQLRLAFRVAFRDIADTYNQNAKDMFIGGGLGLGLNVGANFNFGKLMTVTAETGARYQFNYNAYVATSTKSYQGDNYDKKYLDGEYEYFFNLGVLFRIDDAYEAAKQDTRKN